MTAGTTREKCGDTYYVHVRVPVAQMKRATYMAGVEARTWVKELGKTRAVRQDSWFSFENGGAIYRESVCYGFE